MAEALAAANWHPGDVGYIDTHSSGTPVGDAIEVEAMRRAFAGSSPDGPSNGTRVLGSAKANVGNLDAAVGVVGLVKAVLAVREGVLPTPHFTRGHPEVNLAAGRTKAAVICRDTEDAAAGLIAVTAGHPPEPAGPETLREAAHAWLAGEPAPKSPAAASHCPATRSAESGTGSSHASSNPPLHPCGHRAHLGTVAVSASGRQPPRAPAATHFPIHSRPRETVAMECLFCQIVARATAASIVYEDDRVLAVCDLFPVNPGHLLVVPTTHATGLSDLTEADGRQMFTIGQRLAAAIRKTDLDSDGINLFLADGAAAFQEVFHVHLHVIPRHFGDTYRLYTGQSTVPEPRAELDEVARQIRDRLQW